MAYSIWKIPSCEDAFQKLPLFDAVNLNTDGSIKYWNSVWNETYNHVSKQMCSVVINSLKILLHSFWNTTVNLIAHITCDNLL